MCGIAGFWQQGGESVPLDETVRRMTDALRHRGPDADGHWIDAEAGIALGHRRLSILDLTAAGAQPMTSPSGRYVITFNGEIYNWRELRAEEERYGAKWCGHADTEVLLALIDRVGLAEALKRAVGMWALGLWDRKERALSLARDRLGEKPLYYGSIRGGVAFASELKAFRAMPQATFAIDHDAVAAYLRTGYIPAPLSIYRELRKLAPATILTLRAPRTDGATAAEYWSAAEVVAQGAASPLEGSDAELLDLLADQLRRTVGDQMVADVSLGAFLSGGIDSTAVVAAMQAQSSVPVRTFTIGYAERTYDESPYAREVAGVLGTDHTEWILGPEEVLARVPELGRVYDEPFADSSQVPTLMVAALARRHVTVALSGDGGDELFGGYWRHFAGPRLWHSIDRVPLTLRRLAARSLRLGSPLAWDRMFGVVAAVMPRRWRLQAAGDRVHKASWALDVDSPKALYERLTEWGRPMALRAQEGAAAAAFAEVDLAVTDLAGRMMYADLRTYLPDDVLVKVDRASMAVSLETRAPFLDHRMVELAWRLPAHLKIRGMTGKWCLRAIAERSVSPGILRRPKAGFGLPVERWLRGPLRPWAEDLLSASSLADQDLLDPVAVRDAWTSHLSGRENRQHEVWAALMLLAWQR